MSLIQIQSRWVQLFQLMDSDPSLTNSRLAGPFVSVPPAAWDASRKNVLYVGKATHKDWFKEKFVRSPVLETCRSSTVEFLQEVYDGNENRAFWRFARRLSEIASGTDQANLQNLVWSNIAKVGVTSGNPTGRYLAYQHELAVETLRAEIDEYRPSLVVFVTSSYAEEVIRDLVDDDDATWQKKEDADLPWYRRAQAGLPSMLWLHHPQRKPLATLDVWLSVAKGLLD
ncbi:MAG: hypothetical protein ABSD74_13150 [Rhizomicrobium sp.]|jgi:hypothetical protein